jgi:hypothetical protein
VTFPFAEFAVVVSTNTENMYETHFLYFLAWPRFFFLFFPSFFLSPFSRLLMNVLSVCKACYIWNTAVDEFVTNCCLGGWVRVVVFFFLVVLVFSIIIYRLEQNILLSNNIIIRPDGKNVVMRTMIWIMSCFCFFRFKKCCHIIKNDQKNHHNWFVVLF